MTNRWIQSENEIRELEKSRTEAELKNLRNQLNPHFLFNTLNNIYSLIALSPEKAQQAIMDLSKLLRYVLYDNSPEFVPLQKEMEFVRNYVELMRLRLTDNTEIKISLPQSASSGTLIAPLLFISLTRMLSTRSQQLPTIFYTYRHKRIQRPTHHLYDREQLLSQKRNRQERFGNRTRQFA